MFSACLVALLSSFSESLAAEGSHCQRALTGKFSFKDYSAADDAAGTSLRDAFLQYRTEYLATRRSEAKADLTQKHLVEAQRILSGAGVRFQLIEDPHTPTNPLLEMIDGTHRTNVFAQRIRKSRQTTLVYDPVSLANGQTAYFRLYPNSPGGYLSLPGRSLLVLPSFMVIHELTHSRELQAKQRIHTPFHVIFDSKKNPLPGFEQELTYAYFLGADEILTYRYQLRAALTSLKANDPVLDSEDIIEMAEYSIELMDRIIDLISFSMSPEVSWSKTFFIDEYDVDSPHDITLHFKISFKGTHYNILFPTEQNKEEFDRDFSGPMTFARLQLQRLLKEALRTQQEATKALKDLEKI